MDKKVTEIASLYAQEVRKRLPVKMIILFGSRVKGKSTKSSDIDIAVVVDRFTGDYLKTSAELFNLVRHVDKKIEPVLLSMNNDKSGFLERIIKEGKIIYRE